ncbi:MAG TPA: redoxin domain-containing protein [Actinomycetota bacterium]|nr:redoxin domain-containing protein [Actinomycetota bacterium]
MIPSGYVDARRKRTSSLTKVAVAVAAMLLIASIAYGVTQPARIDPASRSLPEFTLTTLDGERTISRADFAGRPLVINFWASWCIPCRDEAPLLERKWREYRDEGVVFLGVVVKDTPKDALAFARSHDLTYPMVWDPDQTLAKALGLVGLPQTFFVDASGRFKGDATEGRAGALAGDDIPTLGAIEEDELERQIARILETSS